MNNLDPFSMSSGSRNHVMAEMCPVHQFPLLHIWKVGYDILIMICAYLKLELD